MEFEVNKHTTSQMEVNSSENGIKMDKDMGKAYKYEKMVRRNRVNGSMIS